MDQATELKCGGLVVGCTFDHRVADAHSANIFLTKWAEMALAKSSVSYAPPSFRRSLLSPRRPPQHDSSIDQMYVKISSLPPPKPRKSSDNQLISRIYYIDAEEIDRLQSQASYNEYRRTKLESFSAFLWKTIAEGGSEDREKIKLGIVVDGRRCLKGREEKGSQLRSYFGNVLSIPHKVAKVDELKSMQLKGVANLVHECIESARNEQHFLDLIDWVEVHRPEPAVVKVYCKYGDDEEAVVVSSGLRFLAAEMNFGAGKPCFGSYHFPWGGETGYVMPMQSLSREGDWVVYMHMLKRHLDVVEKVAAHVFKPLSSAYVFGNFKLLVNN